MKKANDFVLYVRHPKMTTYFVGSNGTVFSLRTSRIQRSVNGKGYPAVNTRVGGKQVGYLVHRMVAELFVPNPEGLPQVNHIDGNRQNNHPSNLEWVTHQGNLLHASRVLGKKNHWGSKGRPKA